MYLFIPTFLIHCFAGVKEARGWIVHNLLEKDGLFKLSEEDIVTICKLTDGIYHLFTMQLLACITLLKYPFLFSNDFLLFQAIQVQT